MRNVSESIHRDNSMTKNKTAVSSKLESFHIRRALNRPRRENGHHLVGSVVILILLAIVRPDVKSAIFVEKENKETKRKIGTKVPLMNKEATEETRPYKSLRLVVSTAVCNPDD